MQEVLKVSIIIRNMVKEDIKKVQDIAKQSWNTTYDGIIPYNIQENFLNKAYSNEMMSKRLVSSYLFVAEKITRLLALLIFHQQDSKGRSELSAIYLYPSCKGKGIGTAFLQKGIEVIKNIKEIYLEVEKENLIKKRFYEAKGFKAVKEYDDNFDGHILKTVQMPLTL